MAWGRGERLNMDGFAQGKELEEYRYTPSSFYLGSFHPDHDRTGEAGIEDDRHVFVVAGSRAGKGTSIIMQNLLRWPGGVFCIDPKGEAASISAMRRARPEISKGTGTQIQSFMGQHVAILDPFDSVVGPARKLKVKYDPLADLDINSDNYVGLIETITESIVVGEKASHWTDSASTILSGVIEAVLILEPKENQTLNYCRTIILKSFDELETYLDKAKHGNLAPSAYDILKNAGDDERGSFKTTLARQIQWLNNPNMRKHLARSKFSLAKAVRENWSVYVCIPPRMIPRFKRWLRLLVNIGLDAKMMEGFAHEGTQTLYFLDEFAALGHFPIIEDAAAYMAGYGIKLVPVIQNIGQVKKHYGQNWETFVSNAGALIGWALNDLESEKYFAERIGKIVVWEESFGSSQSAQTNRSSGDRESESTNLSKREKEIRWPSEVHQQGNRREGRAFVISGDGKPFTVMRQDYYTDKSVEYENRAFLKAWEKKYAK
jgi:type IV secretion system protein VirD4